MNKKTFQALQIIETPEKTFQRQIVERQITDLPAQDVLIQVIHSSLNYKDALSAIGHKGVTRKYPHTPGIDAAGIVAQSSHPAFKPGDQVIVHGYDLGMNTAGGFAEYIRVPAQWIIKLPTHLTLQESMIYGTAGFTAALSVFKLQRAGLTPTQGKVLVTGATGGVGSIGVALLAKLGYQVIAVTGKSQATDFLHKLGADTVLERTAVTDNTGKPLLSSKWAGVLDTVGGNILTTALKSTQYGGIVSCCGLVASTELATTVYPFIIRGISLLGIDAAETPLKTRQYLWQLMANEWKLEILPTLMIESDLHNLKEIYIDKMLHGQIQGRVVVNCEG
jgi:putative YhdH/YhfP family quinone oxidoreductase